jgi:hypothetical protein
MCRLVALGLVERPERVVADPRTDPLEVALRVPNNRNVPLDLLAVGPEYRLAVTIDQWDGVGACAECDHLHANHAFTVWMWRKAMLADTYLQA